MDLQIGSTIGDYQIVGILGAGGMGKVYKVRNVISDRSEAMKVLLPDLATAPELADRFLREIKVQASLEHPNIASLHTALRVDNQLLMLMEFVEGATLEQTLKNEGPLPVAKAVDYISQVLSALDYAHQHGVVHRDIKPANMMLTPTGTVKLMDFGIAKASSDHKLTMTGTTMGSLYYMSPEQIQGASNLDARADLYSIGVTLYELVTGKRPFDGDSQFAIMSAHLEKAPVPPITLDPRLPQALNDVILMSVMKNPAERFQTAKAFRNALSNVVAAPAAAPVAAAAAVPAPAPADFQLIQPTQPEKPKGKRGLWMAIGALAAVAVVVAAIMFAGRAGIKAGSEARKQADAPAQQAPAPVTPPAQENTPPVTAQQPAAVPQTTPTREPQTTAVNSVAKAHKQEQTSAPLPSQPVVTSPMQTAPPQVQQQAPPPPQPAAPAGPSRAELQQVREQLAILHNRAGVVTNSFESLRRSQAASGMSPSGKFTGPMGLMNSYLQGATDALNAGDTAAAKDFAAKAEKQIEILEKLFNL
jgi:eukaryotic-like serine/threonine-protein kinase